jgi:heterodisulfide reductase subunit A2
MSTDQQTNNGARCGVFLCQCGPKIAPRVDLPVLNAMLQERLPAVHVETLAFPCLAPGLEKIKAAVRQNQLDRFVVAGCEPRLMLKKFGQALGEAGLEEEQIAIVNLRDHVAQAHKGKPADLAHKGSKLIEAAVAGLMALEPTGKVSIAYKGPVMIVGGGLASYSAALEFLRQEIEAIVMLTTDEPEDEIRMLHERFPGERHYHERLRQIMQEVDESPYIRKITKGDLEKVMGRWGDYTVTISNGPQQPPQVVKAGAIIATLDGEMLHQGVEFGHDGVKVLCHTEMEEYMWMHGPPNHRTVFWVNDIETHRPFAELSARGAYNMARYIKDHAIKSKVSILYNEKISLPLSTGERLKARQLGIDIIPYASDIRPTLQAGYITFNRREDQIEQELAWDQLVLSPVRSAGFESIKTAKILGIHIEEHQFLERNPQMVRPDQVGLDEKLIAGSARTPCDLQETLRQGHRAAQKIARLITLAKAGQLYAPRQVCRVDPNLCTGCGLCSEICDCSGFNPVEGGGGGTPRTVDPMVCTGGGTCAAACPHLALSVTNNTTAQREARVASLARNLADNEVVGFGCAWGAAAAADHAGLQGLQHHPGFHLFSVSCVGQIDPIVMGRAFMEGSNGLLLIGCKPETCHHSYGLDHTWSRVLMVKKLLELSGLERQRICLAHGDLNDPRQYVRTVESFMATMERLGFIVRDGTMQSKLKALYDTLHNARVRWVLGAGLRRPWETTYPSDQRHAIDYDNTLTDVLTEEFIRTRITNLLHQEARFMLFEDVVQVLNLEKKRAVDCLRDLASEGIISRIFKDRTPYYSML